MLINAAGRKDAGIAAAFQIGNSALTLNLKALKDHTSTHTQVSGLYLKAAAEETKGKKEDVLLLDV